MSTGSIYINDLYYLNSGSSMRMFSYVFQCHYDGIAVPPACHNCVTSKTQLCHEGGTVL